jgi:outer membrane protein assembly factor BamB
MRSGISSALAVCLLISLVVRAQTLRPHDWLTWGGDVERSGWNRSETALSRNTIRNLELKWKMQIDKSVPVDIESGASMLTAPLVVEGVRTSQGSKTLVLTLAASNTFAAMDTDSGNVVWERKFDDAVRPSSAANWVCTNTSTATPVVDKPKGVVYVLSADGRLHTLAIGSGDEELPPMDFVAPFSRNWSMNLVDGVLYTTVGRGCGNPPGQTIPIPAAVDTAPEQARASRQGGAGADGAGGRQGQGRGRGPASAAVMSQMVAMDLKDPNHSIARFVTSIGRPGGGWSRAGMAWANGSLLVQTADGAWDPATNKWGQTLLRLAPKTLELVDYFTPANLEELNTKDLDYGSGGVVGFTHGNRQLVVSGGKDGTIYLLDANTLGGRDHRTPLFSVKIGNDAMLYASNGIWGAPATAIDARNQRWIYVPVWGPPSRNVAFRRAHGDAPHGSVMALQVTAASNQPALTPMWISRDLNVPDPPVVANGLVFAISTGENTIQRHTDPRYAELYQRPGAPPVATQGTLTPQERGQQVTHATLYALDAETGQELYSSKDLIDDWTHLSSVTVAGGKVFVTTRQTFIYAFGLKR